MIDKVPHEPWVLSQGLQRKFFKITARNFSIPLRQETKIMGIINLTPDSFSQDGLLAQNPYDTSRILEFAQNMVINGADILDIGGESTRPGARRISNEEEISRVIPAIKILAKRIRKPISIDSYKEEVVHRALDAGASLVNNIQGTRLQKSMLKIIQKYDAAVILMHMRGTPQTMQSIIHYDNLIEEIIEELRKSKEKCLEFGIKSDKIIIDPGICFSKTVGHNLEIIRRLSEFQVLDAPILIGPSRKSFIGKVLNKDVSDRLLGTAAAVCACIFNGAHMIRVHDVKEIRDVIRIADAVIHFKKWNP